MGADAVAGPQALRRRAKTHYGQLWRRRPHGRFRLPADGAQIRRAQKERL